MAEWRVTRKKRHEDAGNIAAIGHLKEEVCRLTGRPHIPALIELARVIWPELSAESVTYALRARKKARSQTK